MTRRRGVLNRSSTLVAMLLTASVMFVLSERSAMRAVAAETVEIPGELIKIKPGDPLSGRALVQKPGRINGVMSWTLETRRHRGAMYHVAISPDGKTLAT